MKKSLILFFIFLLFIASAPRGLNAAEFPQKLKGLILLQAEDRGQLWYVNPAMAEKYFFYDAAGLFKVVKAVGLGIANKDFDALNRERLVKLSGRILIKVQDSGRAYYVKPVKLELVYLGRPAEIFKILAGFSLGVANNIIRNIKTNENFKEISRPAADAAKKGEPDGVGFDPGQPPLTLPFATTTDEQTATTTTPETPDPAIATSSQCRFFAEYFANKGLFDEPATTTYQEKIDFDWGLANPPELTVINRFSIRWTASCYFKAGTYRITAIFDDAMSVYFDNENIIRSWTDNDRTRTFTQERPITEGEHDIKVEYYEAYGKALARFNWEMID